MTLQTAAANIKTAITGGIASIKADATKVDTVAASMLNSVDSEINTVAAETLGFIQKEEGKAAAWETKHLRLLNLLALGGWLVAIGELFVKLHG